MHICIATIASRDRECRVSYREEQFMIFTAALRKALSVGLEVGIGFLGDIRAQALSLGRRGRFSKPGLSEVETREI